ncbi:MAG: hypothetical protein J0I97_00235 [Microbacterium sp.]|nr:hypothetical protein [Microbacterium sp.]
MLPSRRALAWLTGWMLAGFAVAVAVLPFVRDSWPAWVLPAVLTVFATSVAGPLLIGGWMLGRAVAPAGGVVGFVFALGMIAGPAGQAVDVPWVMWAGYAGLVVALVGLVLLGLRKRIARASRRRTAVRRARREARLARTVRRNGGAVRGEDPRGTAARRGSTDQSS